MSLLSHDRKPSLIEPLPSSFYARDPLEVARDLLGCRLVHHHPAHGDISGVIVETEAYRGEEDQACHARVGRTPRTAPMYGPPGHAYVYLIYGMYNMLNATAWPQGQPAAVLIRAIEPLVGIERTTDGPGKLTKALKIDRTLNNEPLIGPRLSVCAHQEVAPERVATGPRIGVDYAGEWALLPWRFWIKDNRHVSKPR